MLHGFNKAFEDSWRLLLNTFWFVPTVVSFSGLLFAALFLTIDARLQPGQTVFVFHGGTGGSEHAPFLPSRGRLSPLPALPSRSLL